MSMTSTPSSVSNPPVSLLSSPPSSSETTSITVTSSLSLPSCKLQKYFM